MHRQQQLSLLLNVHPYLSRSSHEHGYSQSTLQPAIQHLIQYIYIYINGMEWDEMEWNGMEWNGMGWNGMEWDGINKREIYDHSCSSSYWMSKYFKT
jgi:hypothetical protein